MEESSQTNLRHVSGFPCGTEKTTKYFSQARQSLGPDFKSESPKYEAGMVIT
jgi:hypothetical protein